MLPGGAVGLIVGYATYTYRDNGMGDVQSV